MIDQNAQGASDERARLGAALDLVLDRGRDPATDAELESIARALNEERRGCLAQLAALPAIDDGVIAALSALEEPFRCLLFIRAQPRLGEIIAIDRIRLILYTAGILEGLEAIPGIPGRLLASLLAAYIKQRVGPDFLRRLPPGLPSSEVKPLVRYLIQYGDEGQKETLRAILGSPNGLGGDRLANLVIEGAVESLFGQAMVHRVRHQPTSMIYYDLLERCVDFAKDDEKRSLLELLEKTTVARAKELQSLMDELLFAEYRDSRLLERLFGEGSMALRFGGEGAFVNAIDMTLGDRPVAFFGGKSTGLLAYDATRLSTRRWDLGIQSNIRALASSASGALVAVGYENGSVAVFEPSASAIRFKEAGLLSSVRRILFSKDERLLVAAGNREDDAIVLVDLARGEKVYLKGHGSYVNDLVLSPDGRTLYSAGHDRLLIEWDLEAGRAVARADAPASLKSLCLSPDGKYLYSGDNRPDGLDRVTHCGILRWSARPLGRKPTVVQERAHGDSIRDILVSASGKYLFSSSLDGQLRIWDATDGHLCFDFPAAESSNRSFFLSPDCRYCATGDSRGTLTFWNIEALLEEELEKITAEHMRLLAPYRLDLREGTRLEVEKILGDYQLRGCLVRTFPNMIRMVVKELSNEVEGGMNQPEAARRLELITIIHETAHAVGVIGARDRRDEARSWPVELHEAIAQYATWYLAKYDPFDLFRDPGLLELFERLSLHQPPEYRAFALLPSGREDLFNALGLLEREKRPAADPAAAGMEASSAGGAS